MNTADLISTISVAVLGPTGVGKSTYLASLYYAFQRPVHGLTARSCDPKTHDELLKVGAGISRGSYPPATMLWRSLTFDLFANGEPMLKFNWHDYAGGALDRMDSDAQTRALLDALESMEALIILFDSSELDHRRPGNLLSTVAMANSAVAAAKQPITLVVLLSKSDLISNWSETHFRHLVGFFRAVSSNSNIDGVVFPVSCSSAAAPITPPVLYLLSVAVGRRVEKHRQMQEHKRQRAMYWREQSEGFFGFLSEIVDNITGTPTDSEMAADAESSADVLGRQAVMLELSASLLGSASGGLVRIRRDNSAQLYASQLNNFKWTNGQRDGIIWR